MLRTHYNEETAKLKIGDYVEVCGWVDARRDHGGIVFLICVTELGYYK